MCGVALQREMPRRSKMPLAMQLIFTPMIWQLVDRKKRAL
jgi:phosphoribulokinase